MTEYSEIPHCNELYLESKDIEKAITYLDTGGSMTHFTVAQAPPGPPVDGELPAILEMAVRLTTVLPNPPSLVSEVRASMIARLNAIATEMAGYGVTYTPPTL